MFGTDSSLNPLVKTVTIECVDLLFVCDILRVRAIGSTNRFKRKKCYIHRLVAAHFRQDTKVSGEKFVHHKDGNEANNQASNLEWTTLEQNLKARKYFYKSESGKIQRKKKKEKGKDVASGNP